MVTLVNRAKVNTATTGTGTLTLGSAVDGYQTFADAGVADADVVRYVIEDGANWEIGTGTYTATGTTMSRTPSESSNAGAAISLSGSAVVYVAMSAAETLQQDDIGATIQAHSTVLDNTTASFTTTQETKLAGIETGATADQTITAGSGLIGGGTGDVTISHADTSTQSSVNNSGRTFVQDITLDGYGHVTAITSATDADTYVGTVTSVAATVPTGFSISGSPITASGTLGITYATGYQGFTSAESTKLAGIEAGATADQTATEILTAIKTVDGSGSGLDADLLDGQHGAYYQSAATAITTSNIGSQSVSYAASAGDADTLDGNHATAFATAAQGELADSAVQPNDGLGYVGNKTSSYTLGTTDVGEFVTVGAGGSIVVPNSVFSAGDVITIFNNTTGDVTITINTTLGYVAGADADVSSATLATRGLANVFFIDATTCVLTGNVS